MIENVNESLSSVVRIVPLTAHGKQPRLTVPLKLGWMSIACWYVDPDSPLSSVIFDIVVSP